MSKKEIIQALCLTLVPLVIALVAIFAGSGSLNYGTSAHEGLYVVSGILCYILGGVAIYKVIKNNLPKKEE